MSGAEFYELSQDEQVRRLEALARNALSRWSLEGAELSAVAYRENMTFSADGGERGRFALRVHQAGYRSDAQIQNELDYMDYLNGEGIPTPRVVRATDGRSFVTVEHDGVLEARQCDLFEWIEGKPLRKSGEPPEMSVSDAAKLYRDVGRQAAAIYDASERWARPRDFDRPVWDAEGIFGVNANLGNFRDVGQATDAQRGLLDEIVDRLNRDLDAFGKTPDRYGLSHGDFLSENIMVCRDGLRMIDFDDSGDSWYMFDTATAVFDLVGSDYFDPCLEGFVSGFRELRNLSDEQLAMLPAFIVARLLSYLGHAVSRSHLEQSSWLQPVFLGMLEEQGAAYLRT